MESNNRKRTIGKCIYCGSTEELSDEHAVPFSLAGNIILEDASCEICRKKTEKFENKVTHEQLLLMRSSLKYPTRHKKKRPESFEFKITTKDNENNQTVVVPIEECPAIFTILTFLKPRYMANYQYSKGIMVGGHITFASNLKNIKDKYNLTSITRTETLGIDFAKLLAKIAYCITVFYYGLEPIKKIYVLPAILNEKDDIGYWVGSFEEYKSKQEFPPPEPLDYKVDLYIDNKGIVFAKVRLFPCFGTPEFLVIVGEINKELIKEKTNESSDI